MQLDRSLGVVHSYREDSWCTFIYRRYDR